MLLTFKPIVLFFLTSVSSSFSLANGPGDWVIYGEDHRQEIGQSQEWALRMAAPAVAMRVRPEDFVFGGLSWVLFAKGPSAQKKYNLCPEVRFSQQVAVGSCTGFLIAPDILVTAGHCMRSSTTCVDFKWAFHYRQDLHLQGRPFIFQDDLYTCQRILAQINPGAQSPIDLAIIELDRPVKEVTPLRLSHTADILKLNADMFGLVGFPLGLAQKTVDAASAHPRVEHPGMFSLNLDSFGNNSGSPVIHLETGEVEGMLVAGESDWEMDLARGCKIEKRCEENSCRGESIVKASVIRALLPQVRPSND